MREIDIDFIATKINDALIHFDKFIPLPVDDDFVVVIIIHQDPDDFVRDT